MCLIRKLIFAISAYCILLKPTPIPARKLQEMANAILNDFMTEDTCDRLIIQVHNASIELKAL
jgi:hypothetical protein